MIRQFLHSIFSSKLSSRVLLYHRIADAMVDPWNLCVGPRQFEDQLHWLKKNREVLPLKQYVARLKANNLSGKSVAITFDDGYLDNYTVAKPLLEAYDTPATFFIAPGLASVDRFCWWDELQYIFLETDRLPALFSLQIGRKQIEWDLQNETTLNNDLRRRIDAWKDSYDGEPVRASLYIELWKNLRSLTTLDRRLAIQQIKEWAGIATLPARFALMNPDQIRLLASHKLIAIEAHTVTHPALSAMDAENQLWEMKESKRQLEHLIEKPIHLIAYPYGNYNETTLTQAKSAGFEAAFTTEPGHGEKIDNYYRCPRWAVTNNMDLFRKNLT